MIPYSPLVLHLLPTKMSIYIVDVSFKMAEDRVDSSPIIVLSFFSSIFFFFYPSDVFFVHYIFSCSIEGSIFSANFAKNLPNAAKLLFSACTSLTALGDHKCIIESIFFWFSFLHSLVIICPPNFPSFALNKHFSGSNFISTCLRFLNVSLTSHEK